MLSKLLKLVDGASTYIMGGLLITSVIGSGGTYVYHLKYENEVNLRKVDKASYEAASKEAEVRALAKARTVETKNAESNEEWSQKYSELESTYRANLLRYTSKGSPSKSNLSATSQATSNTSDTSGSTLVSISMNDASICGVNTAKAQAWLGWYNDVYKNYQDEYGEQGSPRVAPSSEVLERQTESGGSGSTGTLESGK